MGKQTLGSPWRELGGGRVTPSPCGVSWPPARLQQRWAGLSAARQRAGGDRFPCPDPKGGRETLCQAGGGGQLPSGRPAHPRGPPAAPAGYQVSLLSRLHWRKPEPPEEGTLRHGRERDRDRETQTDRQTEQPQGTRDVTEAAKDAPPRPSPRRSETGDPVPSFQNSRLTGS